MNDMGNVELSSVLVVYYFLFIYSLMSCELRLAIERNKTKWRAANSY